MASQQRHEELLRAVEQHHERYLQALRALHEALPVSASAGTVPGTGTNRTRSNSFYSARAPEMVRGGGGSNSSNGELPPHGSPPLNPRVRRGSPTIPRPITYTLSIDSNNNVPVHSSSGGGGGSLGIMSRSANVPVSLYSNESDTEEEVDFIPLPLLPLVPNQQQQQRQQTVTSNGAPPPRSPTVNDDVQTISSVRELLPPQSFSGEQLVKHVKGLEEAPAGTLIALLDEVWRRRGELDEHRLLSTREDELYGSATYEVYDVGADSVAVARHDDRGSGGDGALDMKTVWNTIKDVPSRSDVASKSAESQWPNHEMPKAMTEGAVGRMTILQEPSPIMLSTVHLTLADHFDMDELIQHLVTVQGNKGKTRAYMNRAFDPSEVRQRSFFFVFKYYTVVGEGLSPAPYQQFDRRPQDHKSPDHIDITECSSVLALSLAGPKVKEVYARRGRKRAGQVGSVFDHFAPWHLLSMQSFADNEHSMRSDDAKKPFYSGPYAFLDSLAAEYRDAVKRYTLLNELITKLITPSNPFMFEVRLRDKLLFEDKYFTYSRRYFWAYNSLGIINDGIKSMIAAYVDTFTPEFWEGRHPTLWPLLSRDEALLEPGAARCYLDKMAALREDLKRAVQELWAVHHKNEGLRKEIKSLREQLFNGSSVRESRRAVEQGDNIKILTSVSMIFLPLTFVTSVFGITQFPYAADNWRFATILVCVCIPFFALILILQTEAGMEMCKKAGRLLGGCFRGEDEQTKYRRELQSLAARAEEGRLGLGSRASEGGLPSSSGSPGGGGLARQTLLFGRRSKPELGGRPAAGAATDADAEAQSAAAAACGGWPWLRIWRRAMYGRRPRVRAADERV